MLNLELSLRACAYDWNELNECSEHVAETWHIVFDAVQSAIKLLSAFQNTVAEFQRSQGDFTSMVAEEKAIQDEAVRDNWLDSETKNRLVEIMQRSITNQENLTKACDALIDHKDQLFGFN